MSRNQEAAYTKLNEMMTDAGNTIQQTFQNKITNCYAYTNMDSFDRCILSLIDANESSFKTYKTQAEYLGMDFKLCLETGFGETDCLGKARRLLLDIVSQTKSKLSNA